MRFLPSLLLFLLMLAPHAHARQADGTLGLIQTPNNGIPALVLQGGNFEAVCGAEASLTLRRGESTLPLEVTWTPFGETRFRGEARVPQDAAPGEYVLEAVAGEQRDTMPRAVYVYETMPDYYVIAHVSDTHVGSGRHPRSSEEIVAEVFNAVNESEAHIALITGDLTDGGTPEQFQAYLRLMDTLKIPSFVCPGNHDRLDLNYENFFGPVAYTFRFGPDGYLSFDSKDYIVADSIGNHDEELQVLRREIKDSRWSIGFSHRYEASMGMRSQLTLFVDDPLHYLLFGHWHRENTAEQQHVPWGTTRMTVVPAAINGVLRFIDVTENRLLIREAQRVAETGRAR
jgi:hypothetical protein